MDLPVQASWSAVILAVIGLITAWVTNWIKSKDSGKAERDAKLKGLRDDIEIARNGLRSALERGDTDDVTQWRARLQDARSALAAATAPDSAH